MENQNKSEPRYPKTFSESFGNRLFVAFLVPIIYSLYALVQVLVAIVLIIVLPFMACFLDDATIADLMHKKPNKDQ